LSLVLLIEVGTGLKEVVEGFANRLFPEEFPLAVLVQKLRSSVLHFVKVATNIFHRVEELKLISDFNKVISASGVLVIKAGDLDGDRDEIVGDLVEDVPDAVASLVRLDRGEEVEFSVNEVNLDLEDGSPHMNSVGVEVDLVGKESHGGVNSDSNSFNEESVHIVDVLQPHVALFVGLNVVLSVSQELVDLFTLRLDFVMAGSYSVQWNCGIAARRQARRSSCVHKEAFSTVP